MGEVFWDEVTFSVRLSRDQLVFRKIILDSKEVDFKDWLLRAQFDPLISFLYEINIISSKLGSVCFIDLGANYGLYSLALNEFVDKVFAIEALPKLAEKICESTKINQLDNISVINKACGKHEGEVRFQTGNGFGSNKIDERGELCLELFALDSLNFEHDRILFKFDIEGGEYNAFLGFEKKLNLARNLSAQSFAGVCEFNNSFISSDFNLKPHKFYNFLSSNFSMLAYFPHSQYFYDCDGKSYEELVHSYYMYRSGGPNVHLDFCLGEKDYLHRAAGKVLQIKELPLCKEEMRERY